MMASRSKTIYQLLNDWHDAVSGTSHPRPPKYDGPDVSVSMIVEHSDDVEPGAVFVARVRTVTDGHPYIGEAAARGASLVIGQRTLKEVKNHLGNVPYLCVEDSALAEAWLAAAYYGFPTRQLLTVGITGTDGKTTTTNLLFHILQEAGLKVGMLSTLKAIIGDKEESLALHVTTPEAPVIQRFLRQMVDKGLTHCILEATSHGLAQDRVAAIDFDMAIVTNITHEHLDYHEDFGSYLAAKAKLLQVLNKEPFHGSSLGKNSSDFVKTAILNVDDDSFPSLAAVEVPNRVTYGVASPADIMALDLRLDSSTSQFTLVSSAETRNKWDIGRGISVSSPLIGKYNVYNALAAAAASLQLSIDAGAIRRGISNAPQLTGRMERIIGEQPFKLVVDFAHTPNALAQAIGAARNLVGGRIITVFGSAGKRDVAKRRTMAEISARLADISILTAEDPRTDSLDEILATMTSGCIAQGGVENHTFWRIPDRGQAIFSGLKLARPGDLVLVCGKGHEQSMCFGTVEYPWDDVEAARIALKAFLAGSEMPDLGLPTFDPDFRLKEKQPK